MKSFIRQLFATLLVLVTSGSLSSNPIERRVDDRIVINPQASATLSRTHQVGPVGGLRELYARQIGVLKPGGDVYQDHMQEMQRGIAAFYGLKSRPQKGEFAYREDAFAEPAAAIYGVVQVDAKHPGKAVIENKGFAREPERLQAYFEFVLDEFIFESAFLSGQDSEAMITHFRTHYEIPKEWNILNVAALRKAAWEVDFGGGNKMSCHLEVDRSHVVIDRTLVVTREPPANLIGGSGDAQRVREDLARFERFRIELSVPSGLKPGGGGGDTPDRDFSREWSRLITFDLDPYQFSKPPFQLDLAIEPEVAMKAGLRWDWDWAGGGVAIKKFRAEVAVRPAIKATATAKVEDAWEREFDLVTMTPSRQVIAFWIGLMPVEITLQGTVSLKALASASAKLELSASGSFAVESTVACFYERGTGWGESNEFKVLPTFDGITATAEATASLRGELPLEISALLYDLAGPYAGIAPFVETKATTDPNAGFDPMHVVTTPAGSLYCGCTAGFRFGGGLRISGWLSSLLGSKTHIPVAEKTSEYPF